MWANSFDSDSQLMLDPISVYYSLEHLVIASSTHLLVSSKNKRVSHSYSIAPATTESMMSIDPVLQDDTPKPSSYEIKGSAMTLCGSVGKALSQGWKIFPLKIEEKHVNDQTNFWEEAWKRSLN